MNCPVTAGTGVPVLQMIVIVGALLVSGVALLVLARRRHVRVALPVLLLLVFGALALGATHAPQSLAATVGCPGAAGAGPASAGPSGAPDATLTVRQTSTMTGLAPGIAPAAITGTVTNHGNASTYVVAVTVRIAFVTAPQPGRCSAADYVLLDTVMPFARTLAPGESGNFAGARIGFRDRAINQDSCQRAIVTLKYVTS